MILLMVVRELAAERKLLVLLGSMNSWKVLSRDYCFLFKFGVYLLVSLGHNQGCSVSKRRCPKRWCPMVKPSSTFCLFEDLGGVYGRLDLGSNKFSWRRDT